MAMAAKAAAENFVKEVMARRDASHDFSHMLRVRSLALSLAKEEGLPDQSMEVAEMLALGALKMSDFVEIQVELAALLHDVDDHKYAESEQNQVEHFLVAHGVDPAKSERILSIIKNMGFKEELAKRQLDQSPELSVVQDADRLDAIGAIGIARCFTYGGSRNHVLHDPSILPMIEGLTKEDYSKKDRQQTMINHFYEKLLKLKSLMKTEAGRRRAEKRHMFMEAYLDQFLEEWKGDA